MDDNNIYDIYYWLNRFQYRSADECLNMPDITFELYTLLTFSEHFKHGGVLMDPKFDDDLQAEFPKCSQMLQDVLWQGILQLEHLVKQKEEEIENEDNNHLLS